MQLNLRAEDQSRALEILRSPRTAGEFAGAYWGAEVADDAPGTKSRRGHALLASLVRGGKARRISEGGLDVFVAVGANGFTQAAPPSTGGDEGKLGWDANGNVVRIKTEMVGPVPPPPHAQPAPPRAVAEADAVQRLLFEAISTQDAAARHQKLEQARDRLLMVAEAIPPSSLALLRQLLDQARATLPATTAPAPQPQISQAEILATHALLVEVTQLAPGARHAKLEELRTQVSQYGQRTSPPGCEQLVMMQKQLFDQLCVLAPPPPQPASAPAQQPDMLATMQQAFTLFMQMQTMAQEQAPDPEPYRAPYRPFGVGAPSGHQPPPARVKSAAEQFRESITSVRAISEDLENLGLWSNRSPPEVDEPEDDDRPPIRVVEVGEQKLVFGRNGESRKLETVVANLTPIMRWLGEQREATQRAREPARPQLPPAPVEPQQAAPPVEAPAVADPVPHANGSAPQRRTWSMPTIPGSPA